MSELTPLERIVRGQLPQGIRCDEDEAARRIARAVDQLYVQKLVTRVAELEREVTETYARTVATMSREMVRSARISAATSLTSMA